MNPVWRVFWRAIAALSLLSLIALLTVYPVPARAQNTLPESMSQSELFALVFFVLAIVGAITGAWWRVESKVKEAKESAYHKSDEAKQRADTATALAATARQELSDYRTHVAETYISKAGYRESNEQIMATLNGMKTSIDGTNQRIDRLFDERIKKQS